MTFDVFLYQNSLNRKTPSIIKRNKNPTDEGIEALFHTRKHQQLQRH
jgi:hypothetical protein